MVKKAFFHVYNPYIFSFIRLVKYPFLTSEKIELLSHFWKLLSYYVKIYNNLR